MPSASAPILLIAADAEPVRRQLEAAGHALRVAALADAATLDLAGCAVAILDVPPASTEALALLRRWRTAATDPAAGWLVILADADPAARLAYLEAGADAYLVRPYAPAELLVQMQHFLRAYQLHGRLARQSAELQSVNQRLQQAYKQTELELEAARRLQMSFLPQSLPVVHRARFAVSYRPCGRVGGDFYDVTRLDENHVGFYVADAMGHGMPASLLTIFLKRGVRGKAIAGNSYRLVPPGEVLNQLNRDLLEQALPEMPFITMAYALLNCETGALRFARAGHPHPLLVPATGEVRPLPADGGLLGVFVADFREQAHQLRPGDKLLLHTDGLDAGTGEAAHLLTPLATKHRELPIEQLVARLAAELPAGAPLADDFTILGVEYR